MATLLTFEDLETRYGNEVAHSLLAELEQHVGLNSTRLSAFDPEKRMQLVFDIIGSESAVPVEESAVAFCA